MKNLILHIGHGKTGSTAIQNAIVPLRNDLLNRGIAYPINQELIRAHRHRKIQSGNGYLLRSHLAKPIEFEQKSHLFSSELLLYDLQSDRLRNALLNFRKKNNIRMQIICYTRDFFEYSFSAWHQAIKRGKCTKRYLSWMLEEDADEHSQTKTHKSLLSIFKWTKAENIPFFVFNYDRHKSDIAAHFFSTIVPNPENLLSKIPLRCQSINRSLTQAESEIQRAFNEHYDIDSSSFISDRLVEDLPNQKKYIPSVNSQDYSKILERHGPITNLLNKYLDPEEKIQIRTHEELVSLASPSDPYVTFSHAQIETLARGISMELMRIRKNERLRKKTRTNDRTLLGYTDSIFQKVGLTLIRRPPFVKKYTP